MTAHQLLKNHGMVGTFYINSSFIGSPGVTDSSDLETLKANGHEIGGHSFNHPSLISLSAGEANRQICTDRNTLLSWGYRGDLVRISVLGLEPVGQVNGPNPADITPRARSGAYGHRTAAPMSRR